MNFKKLFGVKNIETKINKISSFYKNHSVRKIMICEGEEK